MKQKNRAIASRETSMADQFFLGGIDQPFAAFSLSFDGKDAWDRELDQLKEAIRWAVQTINHHINLYDICPPEFRDYHERIIAHLITQANTALNYATGEDRAKRALYIFDFFIPTRDLYIFDFFIPTRAGNKISTEEFIETIRKDLETFYREEAA